ncbi:MAG: MFS transporter [Acidobacteriota bacterium]|nr:MFS transporter [Acidobacteriota bacterium]
MLAALSPLRHRDFALLWSAALLSNIGSWMQTVAVGILVTARTGQPGWTGLVAAAGFLPIGLLSPIGGVMADRVDRRSWLFLTTCGETAFAAALAATTWSGRASPALVTLLVLGGGASAAIGFPAFQAMMPDLVPGAELTAAISLSSAQFNLGRVVGPALAGVAIVAGGYRLAFFLNALSFLAVLVAVRLVRLPARRGAVDATGLWPRLAAGARATVADPPARFAVALISVVALTASPFIALVPAMALEVFHSRSYGTSILVTAQGIGAVGGALALTPLVARFGRRRVLIADLVAVGTFLILYGAAPDLWLGTVTLVLVGASYIGVLAGGNTIVQLYAPAALRGRMLGIYMMALGILYPVGALLQGWLGGWLGLRAVTAGGAVVLLGLVGVGLAAGAFPGRLDGPDHDRQSAAPPSGRQPGAEGGLETGAAELPAT